MTHKSSHIIIDFADDESTAMKQLERLADADGSTVEEIAKQIIFQKLKEKDAKTSG